MKFSFLKEKITPDIPVLQMGFSQRTHKSIGIHDDPYVSVVVMQANETVVIIALDLIYGDRSFAYGIKKAVHDQLGLPQEQVIISYSHTHSTVAVTGEDADKRSKYVYHMDSEQFAWDSDGDNVDFTEDVRYYLMIKNKVVGLIEEGLNHLIEGNLHFIRGGSDFGVSRRFPSDGKILWKPNFNRNAMDPDLFLMKFTDSQNAVRGLLYSYACHPTTLGPDNYKISADFPGVVRKILTEKYPDMIPVFLQGCGADIKPAITADNGRFRSCSFDELDQAGRALANDIQQYLDQPDWRQLNVAFAAGCSDVKLYTEVWNTAQWEVILNDPNEALYRKKSIRQTLMAMKEEDVKNHLPYYLSYLRFDDQTCMLCLECEVVSAIGKKIKNLFKEDLITLGYTNSSACYIPSREVLQEGGYERDSFMSAHLAGPFVPEVEDIIIGRAAEMIALAGEQKNSRYLRLTADAMHL